MQKKCPQLDADYIKFISYGRANDEPRYSANYTHWFAISLHKCHSSDLIFKNNHGNPSSGELYYSHRSGQQNFDDTIFRGSHRSCSVKSILKNFVKFRRKHLCRSLVIENGTPTQVFFCFSVNLTKCLRITYLQNTSGRLPLYFIEGSKTCFSL